ncbi:MAG: hypothetical protein ACK40V_04980, partial [Anaerolineales bacterium]
MSTSKKVSKVTSRKSKVKGLKVGKLKSSKVEKPKKQITTQEKPSNLQTFKPETSITTNILRIVAVFVVIGITIYIYSIRDRVEEFTQYGYFGIFLIMMLANATVILPAPGVAVVFAMGSVFNPLGVALSAGIGGA